jgi:hypothetical protein
VNSPPTTIDLEGEKPHIHTVRGIRFVLREETP